MPIGPTRSNAALWDTHRGMSTPARSISSLASRRKWVAARSRRRRPPDYRRRAVVVQGAVRRVVSQVGGQPRRHGDGPHRPPLPLQEEEQSLASPAQDTEGVGQHGVQPSFVAEVARRPPGRVELHNLPVCRAGLCCQGDEEPVHRAGVLDVAEQLAAAGAGDVAPDQGRKWAMAQRPTAAAPFPLRYGPGGPAAPAPGR